MFINAEDGSMSRAIITVMRVTKERGIELLEVFIHTVTHLLQDSAIRE